MKNAGDILDTIWSNRPALPHTPIFEHELIYAGLSRKEKIDKIRTSLTKNSADATLLTAMDDIAWTFNLRGNDVEFNPVFVAYALISIEEATLFIAPGKVPEKLQQALIKEGIKLKSYTDIQPELKSFTGSLMLDKAKTNMALVSCLLPNVEIIYNESVPSLLKVIKSDSELENIRKTMKQDGVAMVQFLSWLYESAENGNINEYEIAEKLGYFRSLQENYIGPSFYPIVGYNGNGAIVHRAVTKDTADPVKNAGMLLCDSGGQYLSGTTDITRTITLGKPTQQQKDDFTLVLKGMIALATAKFPTGTKGSNLDTLARKALWEHGMNYGHGTGHGIGYFLNVHEGPANIRHEYNPYPLRPGMLFSDEPGIYRENEYGIRIENVIACKSAQETDFAQFLEFETLTLCPIDLNLINKDLLNGKEVDWMNQYHRRCYNELSPLMDSKHKNFLQRLTHKL